MNRLFALLPAMALAACAETDAHDHDAEAIGRGAKVDVCHVDQETGTWEIINISENAVSRHLSNHGDWLVAEDDATADGIDDDCDGEIDEDACVVINLIGGLPDPGDYDTTSYGSVYAYDYYPSYYYEYTRLNFYGADSSGDARTLNLWVYDMGTYYEYYYGDSAYWVHDTDIDSGSYYDYQGSMTDEEYVRCSDAFFAWGDAHSEISVADYRDGY